MINRIELAQRFLQTQMQAREDIIGAWIEGSVARGEDTESSDVDLVLVVSGESGGPAGSRGGIDTWLEGIYIDVMVQSSNDYLDPEDILSNPFKATKVKDALILYDPTGHFAHLQQTVQAQFLHPPWLKRRMQFWIEIARSQVDSLEEAIARADSLAICQSPGIVGLAFTSIPLLRLGITPSSTRGLMQLQPLSMRLRDSISEFEGARALSQAQVLALEPVFSDWMALTDVSKWGRIGEAVVPKVTVMAQNGFYQEAVHAMWMCVSYVATDCGQNEQTRAQASQPAQRWLQGVRWDEHALLNPKVHRARFLLQEMEDLAAEPPFSPEKQARSDL